MGWGGGGGGGWGGEEEESTFSALKTSLTSSFVLAFPDFEKLFIVDTEASDLDLGAVLSQDSEGVEKPISFASRTMAPPERRYSTTRKEWAVVVWALKTFRSYLLVRQLFLCTDYSLLVWLVSFLLKDEKDRSPAG